MSLAEKKRLDALVFEQGHAESREKAKALVMAGLVYIDNQKCDKPGQPVPEDTRLEVRGGMKYVSRGGLKLEKAITEFGIDLAGKNAMDVGASTGGFTDCMLQNGAAKVYCVDVGYGQLAWKLRTDGRVVNMERTNIRGVTPEQIGEPLDFATVDASFISLKLILPVIAALLRGDGQAVVLIKPQFEAGREKVGKKGVVRDKAVHAEVIRSVLQYAREAGFAPLHLSFSPIRGPEGNIEYLLHLTRDACGMFEGGDIEDIVERSHGLL